MAHDRYGVRRGALLWVLVRWNQPILFWFLKKKKRKSVKRGSMMIEE